MCFRRSLFRRISGIFALALSFVLFTVLPSLAQRVPADLSEPLLNGAQCTISGSNDHSKLDDEQEAISIGRELYDTQFNIRAMSSRHVTLTCRADPERFDTLELTMGSSDNSLERRENMTIDVYQSGSVIQTHSNITAGQRIDTLLDLHESRFARPESFSIEMSCQSSSETSIYASCVLYFVTAQLLPTDTYTSQSTSGSATDCPQTSVHKPAMHRWHV